MNVSHDAARLKAAAAEVRKLSDEIIAPMAKRANIDNDRALAELTRFDEQGGTPTKQTYAALAATGEHIAARIESLKGLESLDRRERIGLRTDIYLVAECVGKLVKGKCFKNPATAKQAQDTVDDLNAIVKYIPAWVKVAVALALGLGTMIGWKRIVVTVGERIGKSHLTYAQGASAELMAASTIGLANYMGLPVSTTHVLSSGVAGTMAANRSGLQTKTLIGILVAWLLTLPVCIFLGASLFATALYFTLHVLGVK